jgi:hypothetical protein
LLRSGSEKRRQPLMSGARLDRSRGMAGTGIDRSSISINKCQFGFKNTQCFPKPEYSKVDYIIRVF